MAQRGPSQRRSRERLEQILVIASQLIVEQGSESLRMLEIAQRAGISMGSLYQYFPDKATVISTLAERYNAEGRACTARELAAVQTDSDLAPALGRVTDGFYAMYLVAPVMRGLWAATQADKALHALDAADCQAHMELLDAVLARLRPKYAAAQRATVALLLTQLLATSVRLAITLERPQGNALIETFKRTVLADPLGALDTEIKPHI